MAGMRARAGGLVRPRLLASLRPGDLTLVVAPAGSGKTTLLAQYAAATSPVAWCRLAPEDAAPAVLAARLRDALATLAGGGTLVVDDFDVAIGTPAENAAERLLASAPQDVSVCVASRRLPSFNLSRAELGTVSIVTADDLRFRSWEVERLFDDVYGEPLPPGDAAVLTRRTEGWAASLHLFHLSTAGRPLADRRRAVESLSGRSRFARSYLARTVLDELPEPVREFLRRTCVFTVLTADRCDRLLGTTTAQHVLEDLERRQALTTSDDDGATFRYHEVLRRHLESALVEELGVAGVRDWYAAAAALLEADGALSEAVVAYLRAERWPDVARLLADDGGAVIGDDTRDLWSAGLPARMVDGNPWLSLAVARRLAADGRLDDAAARYRHAEDLFADTGGREIATGERRIVDVWRGAPVRPELHWVDRLAAAVRRHPLNVLPAGAGAEDVLVAAAGLLLAGHAADASALLRARAPVPEGAFAALAVRLVAAVADATGGAATGATIERIGADAERSGVVCVARACRAVAAVTPPDPCAARGVATAAEAAGDAWGALLAYAAEALALLLDRSPSADAWQAVAERAHGLGAGTVEAWAVAFAALAGAAGAAFDPERDAAREAARRAEAAARAAGVPGARAVALLALATAGDTGAVPAGDPWVARLAARVTAAPAERPAIPAPRAEAAPRAPVTLRCLGAFALDVAGRDLDWSLLRPRAATALRLLAMHADAPVHRETLLAALWPDLAPGPATHNLQVAVSSLRAFLEPGAARGAATLLVRRGDAYALVLPPGGVADVAAFRQALRDAQRARAERAPDALADALRRATAAYGGDLLPADGPAEWVAEERERLRTQAAAAAAELAELDLAAGRCDDAVSAATRSIEIDRFADASWRLLAEACVRAGDAAAAERARRGYAEMLDALGVRPARPLVSR